MTPAQFNQWLADMQSAGLIRTDYGMTRDAANLLGMTVQNVNRLMRDGTRIVQTDLACTALLRGLGPYPMITPPAPNSQPEPLSQQDHPASS